MRDYLVQYVFFFFLFFSFEIFFRAALTWSPFIPIEGTHVALFPGDGFSSVVVKHYSWKKKKKK